MKYDSCDVVELGFSSLDTLKWGTVTGLYYLTLKWWQGR